MFLNFKKFSKLIFENLLIIYLFIQKFKNQNVIHFKFHKQNFTRAFSKFS